MSKVVLITGGSSGIGKSVAHFLTDKGFTVYGTSRNPQRITEHLPFKLIALDVTDVTTITTAVNTIIKEEGHLDIVINNAGIGITGPLEETPDIEIKNAFQTNVFGPLDVIKASLPHMRKQGSGLIINVTSIAGYMGLPYRGVYSATKGTLELLTEALRMEIKDFNIQMANIAPGDFATNIASGRYHSPILEDSPYKVPYGNTLALMNEHVDHGSDPIEMAEAIYRIINSKKPKIHYKVGAFMQKFSIVLKRILPDVIYEKLLLNHYKL
jgi:NAD(P)-dependent dehydrogenase (short-subunit alcohol dehydrogenase family)